MPGGSPRGSRVSRPAARRAPRSARSRAALALALVTLAPSWAAAARDARVDQQVRELKAIHQEILLSGAMRKLDRLKGAARVKRRRLATHFGSRPPRDLTEALGPQGRAGAVSGFGVRADGAEIPANRKLNGDEPFPATQSEVTLAALGPHLVAAWNDGDVQDGLGYATSSDGGHTWTDGGGLERAGGVAVWLSDPVLAVDRVRGYFYVAGLVIADGPRSGLALVRGAFGPGGFAWETPRIIRAPRDTFPDKPWLAADSLTGNLYVSYTTFFRKLGKPTDQIELQRSEDQGMSWTPPAKLSPEAEDGQVQGSRPAPGPAGELHVVWKTIDTTHAGGGLDAIRIRTSLDAGRTFGPTVTVSGVFTNFCSGPPGFDRGSGLGFPAIAVDGGTGPRRGRIYVGWEESLNFYDDLIPSGVNAFEQEPNATHSSATPFELGEMVRATIGAGQDVDWFRFHGQEGQTAMVYLDSLDSPLDLSLRLWCAEGPTRLAFSAPVTERKRVLLYTLPKTGDYLVSVAPLDDSTGAYRLGTGWAFSGPERGRDQRDLFVAHSDDARSWSVPVRINDEPPGFDDWLPELAVAPDGKPYALWYDWRAGDPRHCGAASTPYLARSDDGGDSWVSLGPAGDMATLWSEVFSNLSPNMGDYLGLVATDHALTPVWADGRGGTPDAFFAIWTLPGGAEAVRGLGGELEEGGLRLRWSSPPQAGALGTAYRRDATGAWQVLGAVEADLDGSLSWVDPDVAPGFRYHYRLGIRTTEGEVAAGDLAVDVPLGVSAGLAIEWLGPNPSAGTLRIQFLRPDLTAGRLEVLDLGGRRVFSRELGEDFGLRGLLDLGRQARLAPGLYVVRLSQSGRVVTSKLVVLRSQSAP